MVVVTGGANGIGRALARRFHDEGARAVVVADLDGAGASAVATELDARRPGSALGLACNVGIDVETTGLIERTETTFGQIDLSSPTPASAREPTSRRPTTSGRRSGR